MLLQQYALVLFFASPKYSQTQICLLGGRWRGGEQNCGWKQEDACLEIPCSKNVTLPSWLAGRFSPNWSSLRSEKFTMSRDGWAATSSSTSEKIPTFPNESWIWSSVSLQPSSLPHCSALECQRNTHTICRSGRAVTAHSGGMLGDLPHWEIAVRIRICVCVWVLETEGGVVLSRRCIPVKSSCPFSPLPLLHMHPSSV